MCRNPLSLDMGWKSTSRYLSGVLYGVAIRFRWIWVGRQPTYSCSWRTQGSQSAFAGYGLEVGDITSRHFLGNVAIRFRWIWVGSRLPNLTRRYSMGRNPLSLDMGWKNLRNCLFTKTEEKVAIRFRWIWVGRLVVCLLLRKMYGSQSAFAGYGLEVCTLLVG